MDPFFTATDELFSDTIGGETILENELCTIVRKRFPLKVGP